jgi:hypothetical protein
MIIYWRVSEPQETLSFLPRWQNKDKKELLRKCWISLQSAITKEDNIVVLWDKCRQTTLDWLQKNSVVENIKFIECPMTNLGIADDSPIIPLMDKRRYHFIHALEVIDEMTKIFPDEIHYFCSDDYLHLPQALTTVKSVFADGWPGFVLPYDYPDRYTLDRDKTAEVFINSHSHWRTVPSCTGVTSALGKIWQQHMKVMKQASVYNSDSASWEIYAKAGAICPIPGLTTHLCEGTMTPRVNWEQVYDSVDIGEDDYL